MVIVGTATIIGAAIAVVGSIAVAWIGARTNHTKTLIEGLARRVDQLEEQNREYERHRQEDTLYIGVLIAHIWAGKPPPPPARVTLPPPD